MMRNVLVMSALVAGAIFAVACPAPNGYRSEAVFPQADFDQMTGMHWIPGDASQAVVLTQSGTAWKVNTADPNARPVVFLDVSDRMIPEPADEEGLLGLAFAPDFATTGRFYVHYTAEGGGPVRADGQSRQTTVSRFIAVDGVGDPNSEEILFQQPQPFANHNGGAMAFGPDGYLYIGLGDGGSGGDPEGNGQRLDTILGKILRIDVFAAGYTVPASNPFVGLVGARTEIFAYGFRNPWRLSFDTATGQLWVADVGQEQMEEVDVVVAGGNYGWNRLEGSQCYDDDECDRTNTIAPVAEYTHEFGCSITGGYVYRGASMPELQGWYVYGDFCSGRVWAVNAESPGTIIPIADTGKAIASFAQDPAGEVYIVTFNNSIERLVRK